MTAFIGFQSIISFCYIIYTLLYSGRTYAPCKGPLMVLKPSTRTVIWHIAYNNSFGFLAYLQVLPVSSLSRDYSSDISDKTVFQNPIQMLLENLFIKIIYSASTVIFRMFHPKTIHLVVSVITYVQETWELTISSYFRIIDFNKMCRFTKANCNGVITASRRIIWDQI